MLRVAVRLIGVLLCLAPLAAWANAAYVHDLTGKATMTAAGGGPARALKIGDLIDQGTTLRTEADGNLTVKFEDGQVMVLRENTTFRVSEYVYNKQKISDSRAVFNLLSGGMRFITGVIGATNPRSFRLTAGTVTMGIRGTDGDMTFNAITQAVTAAVNAGVVEIATPLGVQTVPANTFTTASPNTPPTPPAPTTQAPAAVQAAVAKSLAQANVPVNTPVVVQASANAAVAQAQLQQATAQAAQAQTQAQAAQAAATSAAEQNQPNAAALAALAQAAVATAAQAATDATVAATLAQQALSTAVQAAQAAYTQAINNGAVQPAAPAAKPGASSSTTGTTGTTGTTSTTGTTGTTGSATSSSSTPSGGAGGGAGGGGTASPN